MKVSLLLVVPCSLASTIHQSVLTLAQQETKDCVLHVDGSCVNKDAEKAGVAAVEPETLFTSTEPLECGVYMAPSTLGDHTNMGMYAGKSYAKDAVIQSEIAIPLYFREWGDHREGFSDGELWDRYIWEGSVAWLDPYTDTNREDSRAVFVPGIGCTINSVMDMNNIESTSGSLFDTAGLHRSKDPGAGAFTPYYASNTTASRDIPAGAELFASYGDYWIPFIEGAQITLELNMQEAEDFLRDDYWPWIQSHKDKLSDDFKQELWKFTAMEFPIYSKSFTVLPQVPWNQVERALLEHPSSIDSSNSAPTSVVKEFLKKQSIRSIDWLNEHGYCQDHLIAKVSTIPQAGRGAFASRNLPKGTIVGYSPLIHMGVHGRDLYYVTYPPSSSISNKKRRMYDLILNYSFGHKNSSVLLTPYGGMVNYMNHQAGDKANVQIRWPLKELVAHKPAWVEKSPERLRDTLEKIGLSFEYVALRDIQEGEEVFLDYGPEWEAAWNEHVTKNWYPPAEAHDYVDRKDLSSKEPYIRVEALGEPPYPDNLVTMCLESYATADDGSSYWLPPMVETQERVYCKALERYQIEDPNGEDSTDLVYAYKVELQVKVGDKDTTVVVRDVPQEGIFLYDRAYSQDWHLPQAFRHEIMIPDHVMPPAWMNGAPPPPSENVDEDDNDDSNASGSTESDEDEDDDIDDDDNGY